MIDRIRAAGGEVRLVWAANAQGDRLGLVPEDWDAPFREDAR